MKIYPISQPLMKKSTMNDVLNSYIIDSNFHNAKRNLQSWRSEFYYYFDNCIAQYLTVRATKKFEPYNDSFFEIIGYLSDWGECNSGIYNTFEYGKKVEEFQLHAKKC